MNKDIARLKEDIKLAEKTQRNTKEQRKTVRFTGERTMEPSTAQYKAQENAHHLRILYAAYGVMRGRKFSEIENKPRENYNGSHALYAYSRSIEQVLEKYNFKFKNLSTIRNSWGDWTELPTGADEEAVYLGE